MLLKKQNIALSLFKTPTQEKLENIEDFFLWCEKNEYDPNYTCIYLKYKKYLKNLEKSE